MKQSTNNYKTHKVHAPEFQGRFFSDGSEAPQAAQHPRTLLGDFKTDRKITKLRNNKHIGYMLQNSGGRFPKGSEAPQAAQHTRTLLGDPETHKKISR